jgi:hypothetical protein
MSGDPEFEDFLKRRRPLFRRDVDDGLEPPAELDRIVLRQARDAIEGDRPLRLFGMPRWAAPAAIAATLVLGLSIVFKTGLEPDGRVPEVRVESIAQRVDYPEARVAQPAEAAAPSLDTPGGVVVDLASPVAAPPLVSEDEARRHAETPPPAPPVLARGDASRAAKTGAPMASASVPSARAPDWRRDARSWQAEIERLRATGDKALADAEQAEFNRQYRAYAVSPDR